MRFQVLDADGLAAALAAATPPVVIDVRPPADYEAGHVPGALHVPVHELSRRVAELPRSRATRLVVIGEPGRRSEAAAAWLVLTGWSDVSLAEGGMAAHRGAVETGPPPPRPPRWEPELRVIPD